MENLKEQLDAKREASSKEIPADTQTEMNEATENLDSYFKKNPPLQVGDKVPNGILLNPNDEKEDFYNVVNNKPIIVDFYRGSWCPYCNLELRAYIKILGDHKDDHINMVAISPELPDETEKSIDIKHLPFRVFSDIDNNLAHNFGIVFKLPDNIKKIYKSFGIDLEKSQGNTNGELPVPATYVIDANGIIQNMWFNPDYSVRAEPKDVIEAYKAVLNKK